MGLGFNGMGTKKLFSWLMNFLFFFFSVDAAKEQQFERVRKFCWNLESTCLGSFVEIFKVHSRGIL